MRRLRMFNLVTLDGYFVDSKGGIAWFNVDEEFQETAIRVSTSGYTMLFGRITYEHLAGFWPTEDAIKMNPVVAGGMNNSEKVVFSRTLEKADWNNTRLVKDDLIGEVRRLKQADGKDLMIFGSGSIVSQLAQEGLIDEYNIMLNPVALGKGRTLFEGVKEKLHLKLISTRTFRNGNVYLKYELLRRT